MGRCETNNVSKCRHLGCVGLDSLPEAIVWARLSTRWPAGLNNTAFVGCKPESGILKKTMRRGIHISVSFIAVLLLLKPFDCFSSGPFTQKAADCCKKGKCVPSTNADDCCKATLPGGKHVLASKAPRYSTPTLDLISTNAPGPIVPAFAATTLTDVYPPTGSPPRSHVNLPLLI